VHQSTGLDDPEGPLPHLHAQFQKLADAAMPHYEKLAALAIK
jgi:hypothetical protein